MHVFSLQRSVVSVCFLVVALVGLTACDSSEPHAGPDPVTLSFTQRNVADDPLADLGTYTAPLPETPVLEGALKQSVSLEGYLGSWSTQRVDGDSDKDVVVFLLTFDGAADNVRAFGGAARPRAVDAPRDVSPTGSDRTAVFEGTFYAFLVDGIGDTPDVPVRITLRGANETRTLTVDPAQHTLPGDVALHLRDADVDLTASDSPTFLTAAFQTGGIDTSDSGAFSPPYPVYLLQTPQAVAAGPVIEGSSIGVEIPESPESFDFYVFQVR